MQFPIFLSIQDAAQVYRRSHRQHRQRTILAGAKTLAIVTMVASVVFVVASGPAQIARLDYWWSSWLGIRDATESQFSPSQFLGHHPEDRGVDTPAIGDNRLVIPSINVDAPILWDIPLVDALNGLQRGVVQAHESVAPDEDGRTFIIGHSAGYWWNDNPWTKVFALLDHLEPNDLIFLKHEGVTYGYRVTGEEIVAPSDVHVVRDETLTTNQLTLMTCTPVGTTLNRLIIYAEPIPVARTTT